MAVLLRPALLWGVEEGRGVLTGKLGGDDAGQGAGRAVVLRAQDASVGGVDLRTVAGGEDTGYAGPALLVDDDAAADTLADGQSGILGEHGVADRADRDDDHRRCQFLDHAGQRVGGDTAGHGDIVVIVPVSQPAGRRRWEDASADFGGELKDVDLRLTEGGRRGGGLESEDPTTDDHDVLVGGEFEQAGPQCRGVLGGADVVHVASVEPLDLQQPGSGAGGEDQLVEVVGGVSGGEGAGPGVRPDVHGSDPGVEVEGDAGGLEDSAGQCDIGGRLPVEEDSLVHLRTPVRGVGLGGEDVDGEGVR